MVTNLILSILISAFSFAGETYVDCNKPSELSARICPNSVAKTCDETAKLAVYFLALEKANQPVGQMQTRPIGDNLFEVAFTYAGQPSDLVFTLKVQTKTDTNNCSLASISGF